MSLIELHPDLGKLVKAVDRVGDLLEAFLKHHGIPIGPPNFEHLGPGDVSYATDNSTLQNELNNMVVNLGKAKPPETEDEADDTVY